MANSAEEKAKDTERIANPRNHSQITLESPFGNSTAQRFVRVQCSSVGLINSMALAFILV